ncbi:MAG TPA: hypothetical protein VF857_05610 [Spirochaetota bacterium]
MEIFDGFIAAIASEFKIKFHKSKEGVYNTNIEFDNNRSQNVMVTLTFDESGDRLINYYSIIAKVKSDYAELFKYALKMNAAIDYGAIALLEETLILRNTLLLEDCDPHQFVKSLTYIAAKADEMEELLTSRDDS